MHGTLEGMPPYHGRSDGMIHAFFVHGLGSEEKGWERDALGAGKRVGSILVSALHCVSSLADRIVLGIMFTIGIYGMKEQRGGGREGRKRKEREEGKKPLDRLCGLCLASSSGF